MRVFDVIGTVDDQYQVVIEEYLQPIADAALGPPLIVCLADFLRSAVGRGDALDLAQYAGGAARDRLLKLLLLAIERYLVRSPRGGEGRNDEANHRDGNDRADRQHQTQARPTPARLIAVLGDFRRRRSTHAPTFGGFLVA